MMFARRLDLTEEQRSKIREAFESHREAMKEHHEQMRDARRAVHEAAVSGDEQAVRHAADALGKVVADAAVAFADVRREAWNVLTPEQQEKVKKAREAWRKARSDRAEAAEDQP